MKVLISIMPATGHINLAQPIAHELVTRGHQVYFLTGPSYKSSVEAIGATFIPFNSAGMSAIEGPISPEAQTKHGSGLGAAVSILTELFVSPIGPVVAQYQEVFEEFKVDVILADLVCLPAYVWRGLGGPVNVTLSLDPLFTMQPEIPPWGSSAWPP
jgi:UDP:flavonoid glycosyltransferase YjiC (YdhE family)